jgi:hypothetical protein
MGAKKVRTNTEDSECEDEIHPGWDASELHKSVRDAVRYHWSLFGRVALKNGGKG